MKAIEKIRISLILSGGLFDHFGFRTNEEEYSEDYSENEYVGCFSILTNRFYTSENINLTQRGAEAQMYITSYLNRMSQKFEDDINEGEDYTSFEDCLKNSTVEFKLTYSAKCIDSKFDESYSYDRVISDFDILSATLVTDSSEKIDLLIF